MPGIVKVKLIPEKEYRNPDTRLKSHYVPEKIRQAILERDNGACQICGKKAMAIAHRVPLCRGGTDELFNRIALCAACNKAKGSKTVEELCISPYFRFDVLKVDDLLLERAFRIKVIFPDGEELEGECFGDPNHVDGDITIYSPGKPGKIIVNRSKAKYIQIEPFSSEEQDLAITLDAITSTA